MPKSMVIGDKLNIPITIYSGMDKAIDFDYLIMDWEKPGDGKKANLLKYSEKKNVKLDAKGQTTIVHMVDSTKTSLKSNEGMIYLQISLRHKG